MGNPPNVAPEEGAVQAATSVVESSEGPEYIDSPVGGVMDVSSPFTKGSKEEVEIVGATQEDGSPGGDSTPLKSALSTDVNGNKKSREGREDGPILKRNVSWADFHSTAALTTVVEFERDTAPSSPTSIDSWEGEHDNGCVCCSLQ